MSKQENIETTQPTWQEIKKAINEIVVAGFYYKKSKDDSFLKKYKKLYTDIHQHEEPQECIINQAKTLFPNKEKYFQMKEQYKNWHKYEPRILKSVEKLNIMYYKLAKDYFDNEETLLKDARSFLESDDADAFLNSE